MVRGDDSEFGTLIGCAELADRLDQANWRVVDCRFDLTDTQAGLLAYLEEHVPGACYAHLEKDLSGPPTTDVGRHPLPPASRLESVFGRLGIDNHTQVVAYDDAGGAMAARLWWLLRYMGHTAVCVLDGGWAAWKGSSAPTLSGDAAPRPARFVGRPRTEWLVTLDQVPNVACLVDARAPERYRGEREPLDVRAGHIPGAINHPFGSNLNQRGEFEEREVLRRRFNRTLGDTQVEDAVHYCGSGVTACHNLLAIAHAGLPAGRLYAGSWSEWCSDSDRPIATGDG